MSAESHRKYLEQMALREAEKTLGRKGGGNFTKEDFGKLLIQTVEPWKRISVAVFGMVLCILGVFTIKEGNVLGAVICFLVGIPLLVLSINGKKKTVESALESIDFASGLFDLL